MNGVNNTQLVRPASAYTYRYMLYRYDPSAGYQSDLVGDSVFFLRRQMRSGVKYRNLLFSKIHSRSCV